MCARRSRSAEHGRLTFDVIRESGWTRTLIRACAGSLSVISRHIAPGRVIVSLTTKPIPMNNRNSNSLQPRPVRDSKSEMTEIVLPNDTNPLNALLGGRLMHWIDMAGAMAAHRHSRQYVVTASIDHLDFLVPVHVGDLVVLRSSVNRVFHTSMEVGVKVLVENYHLDEHQPRQLGLSDICRRGYRWARLAVAPVIPETEEERRRFEDAGHRREIRRAETARRKQGHTP